MDNKEPIESLRGWGIAMFIRGIVALVIATFFKQGLMEDILAAAVAILMTSAIMLLASSFLEWRQ